MNISLYDNMHLSDLRRYAKKIGVNSPTKYKKRDLIERIVKIETGEEQPVFSNRGRPLKNYAGISNFALCKENGSHIETDKLLYLIDETKKSLFRLENEIIKLTNFTKQDI